MLNSVCGSCDGLNSISLVVMIIFALLILDHVIKELQMWVISLVPQRGYNSAVLKAVLLFPWGKKAWVNIIGAH